MSAVTSLAECRSYRQSPISEACRVSAALERILITNLRFYFAWQRVWLRHMG
jgi:hypothetical protein